MNKKEGISPEEFVCIIFWFIAFGAAIGCAWGIINGFLISFEFFERPLSNDNHFQQISSEWFKYIGVGAISGCCIGLLVALFNVLGISIKQCFLRFSFWWSGEFNQLELQKALEQLDSASKQKDYKDIMVCIGRAKECVLRALGE